MTNKIYNLTNKIYNSLEIYVIGFKLAQPYLIKFKYIYSKMNKHI